MKSQPYNSNGKSSFPFAILFGLILIGWPFIAVLISDLLASILSCESGAGMGGYSNCKLGASDFINAIQLSSYFAFFTIPLGLIIIVIKFISGLFSSKSKTNQTMKADEK